MEVLAPPPDKASHHSLAGIFSKKGFAYSREKKNPLEPDCHFFQITGSL